MTPLTKFKMLLIAGACLLAGRANAQQSGFTFGTCPEPGLDCQTNGYWRNSAYVDFGTSTIAGHRTWSSSLFTPRPDAANMKRYNFYLNVAPGDAYCMEVWTYPANVFGMDTRFWVQDGANWVSLDDDAGTDSYSRARVWVSNTTGSTSTRIVTVAPYSASYLMGDFGFAYDRRELTEAACTTAQANAPVLSWVKFKNASAPTFGNLGSQE